MRKVIILAGNGELPHHVATELRKRKIDFCIISFINNKISSYLKKYNQKEINFGRIITELKILKKQKFNSIIMVGGLRKPKISEISPDINSLKLIPMFAKKFIEGGDNNLLSFCIKKLNKLDLILLILKKSYLNFF